MITFLEGILVDRQPTRAVLNVGGVGYEVFIPLSSYERLPGKKECCRLFIYDYVREDLHSLFGFVSESERDVFTKLLNVNGIGPKLALSALSCLSVREIISAVAAGNVERLNSISGIGKKIAERIVVELHEQWREAAGAGQCENAAREMDAGNLFGDAVRALAALGYKTAEARKKVSAALAGAAGEMSLEQVVRESLNR